jgi:hypothetical protein
MKKICKACVFWKDGECRGLRLHVIMGRNADSVVIERKNYAGGFRLKVPENFSCCEWRRKG